MKTRSPFHNNHHPTISQRHSERIWILAFTNWIIGLFAFMTHQRSSSRSGARLPASSYVANSLAQRYVSGLRAHWPGGGGMWHPADLRTQSLDRSPSPSQSPSVYAMPGKAKQINCYQGREQVRNTFTSTERNLRKLSLHHTCSARWDCSWFSRKVPSRAVPTMVRPLPAFSWLVRESRRGCSTFCSASVLTSTSNWGLKRGETQ